MFSENQLELISQQEAIKVIENGEAVENTDGYSFEKVSNEWNATYVGVAKNQNKLTIVIFGSCATDSITTPSIQLGNISVPSAIAEKLYPYSVGGITNMLDNKRIDLFDDYDSATAKYMNATKESGKVVFYLRNMTSGLVSGKTYVFRIEETFLLSENLAD